MEMMKRSCEQFLAELAGKAPTPGGGGTAAGGVIHIVDDQPHRETQEAVHLAHPRYG